MKKGIPSAKGSARLGLMRYKTALALFLVVIVNLVVGLLVWHLDFLVHGNLYTYGLVYSLAWADSYWFLTAMFWAFLGGATFLTATAILPHYFHSRHVTRFSTRTGFVFSLMAFAYQGIGIFYLAQKNLVVWNTLQNYGLQYDSGWTAPYDLFSMSAILLLAIGVVILIISAVRAVVYEIELMRR
jgi:hypothetical protein